MKSALASIFLVIATTAPALAQQKEVMTGSRIPQDPYGDWSTYSDPQTRLIQSKFAQCVVKKHLDAATHYVMAESTAARKPFAARVADGDCLVSAAGALNYGIIRMKLSSDFLQGALADALVRQQFRNGPANDLAAVPPLTHEQPNPADYEPPVGKKLKPAAIAELARQKLEDEVATYLAQYGECVVRANPAASYSLLMTDPTSPQESAAITSLAPALQSCLDAGRTIHLNKASLRGAVAYNYYRLATAPRVPATPSVSAPK